MVTVPDGLRNLRALEELNLEGNSLRSDSLVVDMGSVFLMLAELPRLKRLNLSQNNFVSKKRCDKPPASATNLEDRVYRDGKAL